MILSITPTKVPGNSVPGKLLNAILAKCKCTLPINKFRREGLVNSESHSYKNLQLYQRSQSLPPYLSLHQRTHTKLPGWKVY